MNDDDFNYDPMDELKSAAVMLVLAFLSTVAIGIFLWVVIT